VGERKKAAKRLGKPVSGSVVGRVGSVGRIPATTGELVRETGRDVDSLLLERCRGNETPREVP
jgi:hypothetical protein